MPIYEYQCSACGHTLEAFQGIKEPVLKDCPACGKDTLQKLVSAAGFQLKGTGWYATDFKNKGKPDTQKSDTQSSGSTSTDTKTTETKSSSTTQTKNDSSKAD